MERGVLGNAIRSARMARHMSQEELAEILDITASHLKHIESEHRMPSIQVLFHLAIVLDLSLDALLFPEREHQRFISTEGLSEEEAGAVANLVDLFRRGREHPEAAQK